VRKVSSRPARLSLAFIEPFDPSILARFMASRRSKAMQDGRRGRLRGIDPSRRSRDERAPLDDGRFVAPLALYARQGSPH
jgi:hypothetical protein